MPESATIHFHPLSITSIISSPPSASYLAQVAERTEVWVCQGELCPMLVERPGLVVQLHPHRDDTVSIPSIHHVGAHEGSVVMEGRVEQLHQEVTL